MTDELQLPNLRYPGLPDYAGPDTGLFYGIHHSVPFEYAWSVKERLSVIDTEKLSHERATRRRHIVLMLPEDASIPVKIWAESERLRAESDRLWVESGRLLAESGRLRVEGERLLTPYRDALIAAWKRLVPDNQWDGNKIVLP